VGVTITKKTIPITIGETKLPNKIPNLNQILFNGDNTDEFKRPKIKKIIATITAQILMSSSLNNGNIDTIKKNIAKTTPKFLFDEILILFEFIDLFENYLIKINHNYLSIFLIPLILYKYFSF
jgi:hypothetical protein